MRLSPHTVRALPQKAFTEWDAFVLDRPEATLFQTTAWLEAVAPGTVEVKALYNGERLIGGWALSRNRQLGFSRLLQPPLTPYQAPVFSDQVASHRMESLTRLIVDRFHPFDVLQCTVPPRSLCPAYCNDKKARAHRHPTSRIPSDCHTYDLLSSYAKGARYEIRRARREGLEAKLEIPPKEVLRLARLSMQHAGRRFPLNEAAFRHLVTSLKARSMAQTFGIRNKQGKYIAAQLLVYDRHTAYNLVFGVDRQAESPYAGALLMHTAIAWSLQHGFDFDFEGSSIDGVQQFYDKFHPEVFELQTCTMPRTSRIRLAQQLLQLAGRRLY